MRDHEPSKGRARSLLTRGTVDVAIAAVFLAAGFGLWSFVQNRDSVPVRHGIIGEPSPGGPPLSLAKSLPVIGTPANVVHPAGSGAPNGAAAVDRYLTAAAADDTGASFLLLSSKDLALHDSLPKWQRDQSSMPTIQSYRIGAVDAAADKATVAVSLDFAPTLDVVNGDVPAHADGTFVSVLENGAWYVALADSSTIARWPADQGATDAARTWARARQRCDTADEFDSLVGSPALADPLCGTSDDLSIGDPQALTANDSAPVVAAFGDGSITWSRVVAVGGPHPLRVVLAPLGDSWIVVGVLAASP